MAKVGITGSEGYIGTALREKLTTQGKEFATVDIINGRDIRNREVLENSLSEADSVVHLAALSGVEDCSKNPVEAVDMNIGGTIEVASFCEDNGKRLIFPSSFATDRDNLYGKTKKISERTIEEICSDYLIFKKSNVYGGEKSTVINFFIDKWKRGETLTVHEPGTQVRDFIHLSDVVDAYIQAVKSDYVGKIDLVSGEVITVGEVAEMISDDVELVESPYGDEIFSLDTDPSGLSNIGFQPKISLEQGIKMEKHED